VLRTPVTCPKLKFGIRIATMGRLSKLLTATLLCGFALSVLAQEDLGGTPTEGAVQTAAKRSDESGRPLNQEDRLSLLASAIDGRVQREAEPDCSHLIHTIYEQAGFPYTYAPSSELYAGADHFQRVKSPEPGDLIVWRGHVGMVIKPSQHIFFSFLSSGPGTDDYQTSYWKHRGRPRFYRYIKDTSCEECDNSAHRPSKLINTKK